MKAGINLEVRTNGYTQAGFVSASVVQYYKSVRRRRHCLIRKDVTTLSKEMTTILQNPQNYSSRRTAEPDKVNAGKITPRTFGA